MEYKKYCISRKSNSYKWGRRSDTRVTAENKKYNAGTDKK